MGDRRTEIRNAYKQTGGHASFYDGMMTCSTIMGKAICRLVWNMDCEKNYAYLERALSGVPERFAGKLLEVPVGTGVLTMPLYKSLPGAAITCLDYSADMMKHAENRANAMGLNHISFVRGDVGKLPFADESFDIVLSLNGFHAFPDKDAAFRETCRVLKPGGIFCGCFYIAEEFKRTDFFVRNIYVPKGFFTPPFETKERLQKRLEVLYSRAEVHTVRAEGIFRCVK